MMSRKDQIETFLTTAGWAGAQVAPLAADASFRSYHRVQGKDGTAILMDAPPEQEDTRPFIAVARELAARNLHAPALLAQDIEAGLLLLEDLGDDRFTRVLADDPAPAQEEALYAQAVDVLLELHSQPQKQVLEVKNDVHHPLPSYDSSLLMPEAALFWDWYLPLLLGVSDTREHDLGEGAIALWQLHFQDLQTDSSNVLVLRDYHADNLMWLPHEDGLNRIGLLDFQDAVIGHPAYDLVSLLQDARRDVPPRLETVMIDRYLTGAASRGMPLDRNAFLRVYATLGAQRNTKIIGIFARLAVRDGKTDYLTLIPRVWGLLERCLNAPHLNALRIWYDEHAPRQLRDRAPDPGTS